jgi:hypothetical protein
MVNDFFSKFLSIFARVSVTLTVGSIAKLHQARYTTPNEREKKIST